MMIVPEAQVTDGMTALNARIVPLRWVVRTHGDPHQAIAAITEQLRQASGGFPVARVRTMDEVVSRSTARQSFNMLLLTIFGAVALVLAAIGIYGLMAYSVQQRTQEIGIRMALGADRATIRKLVVWHGMKLALVGVVARHGAAFGLTRLIASFLFGSSRGTRSSSSPCRSSSAPWPCWRSGCLAPAPPSSIPCRRCAWSTGAPRTLRPWNRLCAMR
jgi:putative ABC transport system permease protein